MIFCWKDLDHSLNHCEGLTKWSFVPLGKTLTYKTLNLNNLRKCLEDKQCIYCNRSKKKNLHLRHELPQSCSESKSIFPVWIPSTDVLQSRPRTIFSINVCWSNKYDTHKSIINRRWIEQKTWKGLKLVSADLFIKKSRIIKNNAKILKGWFD